MARKSKILFSQFLIAAFLTVLCSFGAFAVDAPSGAQGGAPGGMPSGGGPGGMPGGMPSGGMPGGGPGGGGMPAGMSMPGAPSKAAIYIDNGAVKSDKEYKASQYKANIKSDAKGITILNLDMTSGDYTFNGLAVTGAKSSVTLEKSKIKLGVTKEAGKDDVGGAAVSVDSGAILYVNNSDLTVDGAQRYVTCTSGDAKLVVNDSSVTQTGSNQFTTKQTEPFSNPALLISGIARANMSVGSSKTYYFNSTVTTEGWAALSTDAADQKKGLDLYAYNTKAIAQNGGYGTYADFSCRVWLYGSTLTSPEVGAIIAMDGQVTVADGVSVPADVIKYNTGKTTTAGSVITAGRNAIMAHAPDMTGQGKPAAACANVNVTNSTLATTKGLKGTRDYTAKYGAAIGAYVDYISGADILVKSTSANINLDNVKFDTFSGVLIMTALNSDSMGNFLKAETDGAEVKPIAISMKNMNVAGDVKHMDYQRIMTLSLENTTLKGAVVSGTVEEWNKLWSKFKKEDCKWVQNDKWNTFYGVKMTVKKGGVWEVSGPSTLSSLTVENGGSMKGKVQVDGKGVTPASGKTYTGKIVVNPL